MVKHLLISFIPILCLLFRREILRFLMNSKGPASLHFHTIKALGFHRKLPPVGCGWRFQDSLPPCSRGLKPCSISAEARWVISSCNRWASPTPTIEKSRDSSSPESSTPPPVRLANAEKASYSRLGVPPRAVLTSTLSNSLWRFSTLVLSYSTSLRAIILTLLRLEARPCVILNQSPFQFLTGVVFVVFAGPDQLGSGDVDLCHPQDSCS